MYTRSVAPPPHPFPEQEHVSRSRTPARFELAGVRVVVASRRLLLLRRLALAGKRAPQRARDARELDAHRLDLAHLDLLRQDRLGRLDGLLVVRVGVGVGVRVTVTVRVRVRVRVEPYP